MSKPNCYTCEHKGTDFYHGLCPQSDSEVLPQEGNWCYYYKPKRTNRAKMLIIVLLALLLCYVCGCAWFADNRKLKARREYTPEQMASFIIELADSIRNDPNAYMAWERRRK